jgi:hypothetical protein
MARLSVWLAPFSPDYSGAASVFFDLNAVTAMHDASGCTGNYTGFDDPRWYGSRAPIYCSGLRELDVVLGDDEKLISKMLMAGHDIHPDVFAVIGSPVPMVTGCDMKGIARELESRSGIVSIGIDTTGTAYYDMGFYQATAALLGRFGETGAGNPRGVNIVGINPMDFGQTENTADLKSLLEENDFEIMSVLSMNHNLDTLRNAPKARLNLAVSRAGFLTAKFMERKYRQPYLAGLPIGTEGAASYISLVREIANDGVSRVIIGEAPSGEGPGVLIIGEQVQANGMRNALNVKYGAKNVRVGSIFGLERAMAVQGDIDLTDERSIRLEINSTRYAVIIADPFMFPLLADKDKRFMYHAQYAVSSKLGSMYGVDFIGYKFEKWYENNLDSQNATPNFLKVLSNSTV